MTEGMKPPEEEISILLVDDRPENLIALEAILEDLGHNMVRACSGDEALRQLLQQEFAVILLDVRMAGLDGFETARMIRKRQKVRDVPIIFITAEHRNMEQISQAYALNAIDYIIKPFDREILRTKVNVLVELQRKTAQVARQAVELRKAESLRQINEQLQNEIDERVLAQQKLTDTIEKLARSNAELEQFAFIASHDLQEPLRSISGYVDLLQRHHADQLDAEASEHMARVLAATNRMRDLIHGLLAYSRVDKRGQPPGPTDCGPILELALANLREAMEESGATVTHDPMPTVLADGSQLLQVFQNLIGNAIKFRSDRPAEIHVGATRSEGKSEWLFSVRDNGIGIDPKFSERIFVVFRRLHTSREYAGTGIGLSICRKIVERHGGRIWVESELGQGSTFFFTVADPAHKEGADHE